MEDVEVDEGELVILEICFVSWDKLVVFWFKEMKFVELNKRVKIIIDE